VEVGKQAQANSITEEAIKKPFFAMDDRSSPPIPIAAAVRGTGIAAAASLAVTVNGCAHQTRNWTRDERRLEGRCRKFGVEYTSPRPTLSIVASFWMGCIDSKTTKDMVASYRNCAGGNWNKPTLTQ